MFFKKKINDSNELMYETFLDSLDDLSQIRVRGVDLSFNLFKEKLAKEDFNLTELACTSEKVNIKRNQNGYYVDESKALNSDAEYNYYQYGLEAYKKYKSDFERIHDLLSQKEIIMAGFYQVKRGSAAKLREYRDMLGYGEARANALNEVEPNHPTKEFKYLESRLLNISKYDHKSLLPELINKLMPYFKEEYKLEIKNSLVVILNTKTKEKEIFFDASDKKIKKANYQKYLQVACPYLEIYLRIISECLKENNSKKGQKSSKV